jgi:hypothetical protein
VEEGRGRAPFLHTEELWVKRVKLASVQKYYHEAKFCNTHLLTPYNPAFWGNSEIGPSKGFGRVF